jgi:hypothetical protein
VRLTDHGLAAALARAAGEAPVSTTVVAEPRRRYGAEIEQAVYFCCAEALQTSQSTPALPGPSTSPLPSATTASASTHRLDTRTRHPHQRHHPAQLAHPRDGDS